MEAATDEPRKRLTREESRAQTRERLVEAAYQLFATEGIEATSIDRIAEQAGYSRGAFYSNFQSKEEILQALTDRESQRTEQDFRNLEALNLPPEQLVLVLRDYALKQTSDRRSCLFYMEIEMYGVRRPEARGLISEFVQKDVRCAAAFLDRMFAQLGVTDHPSSELMVSSFLAMAQGLTMRQVVQGSGLCDEGVQDALRLYFDSLITDRIPR